VRETVAQLGGQYREQEVKLVTELPASVTKVRTDESKLKQIIINLVGNAFKFTHKGTVTVRVVAEKATARPLRIDVADTGIGIPRDRLEAVFEAFQQADASTTRTYGGTGLGLTISRALCQLMGYRLTLASEVAEGTTFSVWLIPESEVELADEQPLHPASASALAADHNVPAPPEPGAGALRHKLILVIDDESDARVLLEHLIEGYGCRVIAASSGEQGLRMAREFRPDLITVDLIMPRMDGWHLIKELKADAQLRNIPILVVSIVANEQAGKILGAVDVVEKPLIRENLLAAMSRNLGDGKSKVLVIDDDPDALRIVTACLAEQGLQTEMAANGREALEVLQRFTPDLIFLDLLMPEMDGITFLDHIRADPRHSHLPVVIITAQQLSASEIQQLSSETRGIIGKAANLKENLQEMLRQILRAEDSDASRLHLTA
jgi:CheY-like chemotaxis protein